MHLAGKRRAAFLHVRDLTDSQGLVTRDNLLKGFTYERTRLPIIDPVRGIHKPRKMDHLLSITTQYTRPGGSVVYEDQETMLSAILKKQPDLYYSFMKGDITAPPNEALRIAQKQEIPVIYFLGVERGVFWPILPVYVTTWEPEKLRVRIEIGELDFEFPTTQELRTEAALDVLDPVNKGRIICRQPTSRTRKEVRRETSKNGYQYLFRAELLAVYHRKCTICSLPEEQLLDAAHIIPHHRGGLPVVTNGLLLCKNHHAAFDGHLIGIDDRYRLYTTNLQKGRHPALDELIELHGCELNLPESTEHRPHPRWLGQRFSEFKARLSIP